MPADSANAPAPRRSYFRNWLSLAGAICALGSFFAFLLLVALDASARHSNPYLGILTYLVAPFFLFIGLALIFGGWWLRRRHTARGGPEGAPPSFAIDLSRPSHRRYLGLFAAGAVVFLLMTAFNSYKTYHFTESVVFCGQVCHTVMEPEFTTYQRSAHARVACAECHIGSGAEWYVKAKISGTYQVYATLMDKYERPIKTPIRDLRPAQETCERCHWPEKFTGNLDRAFEHFLSDSKNTPYAVRLLLHVGGGQPGQGPFGGIHWHMNVAHKVEYYATDPQRQKIPWVRISDATGGPARVYRTEDFKGDPLAKDIRVMDCMDCHNRPAHVFRTANDAVEQAMTLGRISAALPAIKRVAVDALTKDYGSTPEADAGIADILRAKYPDAAEAELPATIEAVRQVYAQNFFPIMKADWRVYPDNIGHKDWPGCFRCHDDQHKSEAGLLIKASDCATCHTILAQGNKEEISRLVPTGLAFDHPDGEIPEGLLCSDCHNGMNQ